MSGIIKVGIVGAGSIVSIANSHLKGYTLNPYSEVAAVYDVVHENAVNWIKKNSMDNRCICNSYEELLDKVDAVSICTPNFTHVELMYKAIKAGKHVFCEKPLSISYKEGRAVVNAAVKAGVVNMIGFCYRDIPAIRYIKELLSGGKLGKIYYYKDSMVRERLADSKINIEWRMIREHSGAGALTDFGSHMIDIADYLLGDIEGHITDVNCFTNIFITERHNKANELVPVTNDDCAVFSAKMEKGALLSFSTSRIGTVGHKIEIVGSGGVIVYDEIEPNKLIVRLKEFNGPYIREMESIDVPSELISDEWFNEQINRFIDAIIKGVQVQPNLQRGLYVQSVIDSIERSAIIGKSMAINNELYV